MFTGLVEEIGKIKAISNLGGGKKITVSAKKIMDDLKIDDSVAINGACQTVVKLGLNEFDVVAVEETLRKTTLDISFRDTLILQLLYFQSRKKIQVFFIGFRCLQNFRNI